MKKDKYQLKKDFLLYWHNEGKKILAREAKENEYYYQLIHILKYKKAFDKNLESLLNMATGDKEFKRIHFHTNKYKTQCIILSSTSCRTSVLFFMIAFSNRLIKTYSLSQSLSLNFINNIFKHHKLLKALMYLRDFYNAGCI